MGRFSKEIVLGVDDSDDKALADQSIAVNGNVTGRFIGVPNEGTFGIHPVGSVVEETVRVRDRMAGAFAVVKVEADDPAVRVEALDTSKGEISYRVRWRIDQPGDRRATVSFLIRDSRAKEHTVSFPMRCYGTSSE